MKTFVKNNLSYIVLALIMLAFAVIGGFGVFNATMPSSYYSTDAMYEDGTQYYNAVCYKVTIPEKTEFNSVWIKYGSLDYTQDKSEIKLNVVHSRSLTGSFFKDSSVVQNSKANTFEEIKPGEWQFLTYTGNYSEYPYVCIYTKDVVKINELAFVGIKEDGKLTVLQAEAVGAGMKKTYSASISKSIEFNVTKDGIALAENLIDEPNSFKLWKISSGEYKNVNGLSQEEYQLLEMVRNVISRNNSYLDGATPFGAYVFAIGTSIFGYNALGIRIMPYLFTLLTIALLYFIGVLLFEKEQLGLIFAGVFAMGGYALSFATLGSVTAVATFFILASLYCAIKFYKKGISSKNPTKGLLNILLGGLAFAIAVATKLALVFFLIPIAVVYAIGLVRQYKAYKNRKVAYAEDQRKSIANIKNYKRKVFSTVAMAIVAYIFLPVLVVCVSYLSVNFNLLIAHLKTAFAVESVIPGFAFLINYAGLKIADNKFIFGNVVLAFVGLIALILTATLSIKASSRKEDNPKLLVPFIAFASFFVTALVLALVGVIDSTFAGYIWSVFASGIMITLYNYFKEKELKANNGKISITCTLTIIVLALALIVFALSVPAYLGLNVNSNLFAFGIIDKSIF